MPRLVNQNPSYRHHKPSGQAVVTLNGEDVYLGPYGSKQSRREYDRVIAEWLARGRQRPTDADSRRVADVIIAYWEYAQVYYGTDGRRPRLYSIKKALAVLRRCYGQTPAREFGPLALQVVRERMVAEGWARPYINDQIGRLKRCFRWAAARELVPASLYHGLDAVDGLRQGESDAPETDPVRPVPEAWVDETLKHLSRHVGGLVRLQLATGMRPGEAVIIRGCDLDTTAGDVWVYRPHRHKTQHRGHERVIHLGPQAKAIVAEFLKRDLKAYLFSPVDAERERREKLSEARGTPLSCGNVPGSNVKRRPALAPADCYTVNSYREAIARACDAAFPPRDRLARRRVTARGRKTKATRWETQAEWRSRLGPKGWAELERWRREHRWHSEASWPPTRRRSRRQSRRRGRGCWRWPGMRSSRVRPGWVRLETNNRMQPICLWKGRPPRCPSKSTPV